MTLKVSALPRRIIENTFRRPGEFLKKDLIEYRIERTFGGPEVLDGWVEHTDPRGNVSRVRAFRRAWSTCWPAIRPAGR